MLSGRLLSWCWRSNAHVSAQTLQEAGLVDLQLPLGPGPHQLGVILVVRRLTHCCWHRLFTRTLMAAL